MKLRKLIIPTLLFASFWGCQNADFDDNLVISNPAELIAEDSDLFGFLEVVASDDPIVSEQVCLEFFYPFTGIIYDEEGLQINRVTIQNTDAFLDFLNLVEEGQYINVSFPITAMLEGGEWFEINNKEELEANLVTCIEEAQQFAIGQCEDIAVECVWEIQVPDGEASSPYENSVFDVNGNLTVTYYHRGVAYEGTWIFYYIENVLHLNINIDDPDATGVGEDWNFDWKIDSYANELIKIRNDDDILFDLVRECDEENYCTLLEFTECELEGQPDVAEFMLEEYLDCIEIIANPTEEERVSIYTFFTTELDATDNTNAIDTTVPFVNTDNPQTIYVRIEDEATAEFEVVEILLIAEECTD